MFGAFGGLLFGYDLGVVSGALLYITPHFGLDSTRQGYVTSSLLLGAMIGALGCVALSDRFGRRPVVLVAGLVFLVGALGAAFTPSFALLLTARLVMGLTVGALSVTVPIYLSEIAPAHARGRLSGLNQLCISSGILVAYLVDLGFESSKSWRWMFGLAAVPAVVLLLGLLRQPESPRWLVKQGREAEAREVLARNRDSAEIESEIADIREAANRSSRREQVVQLIKTPALRRLLFIGGALAFFQQFWGINTIIYYAPTILKQVGFKDSTALQVNVGFGVLTVIVTILMLVLVVDRVGRRRPLILGAFGMAVWMAVLGTVFYAAGLNGGGAKGWMVVAALALFKTTYSLSWGGMVWIMLGEMFPLRVRAAAVGVATFVNWTGNLIVGQYFPDMLHLGTGLVFFIFAGIGLLACGYAALWVPETRDRSLEQIEAELAPMAADRDLSAPAVS
jgi:sugar porter (SP) family MFS transporter